MKTTMKVRGFRCPLCRYLWQPRVPRPKECPRCKARLDLRKDGR